MAFKARDGKEFQHNGMGKSYDNMLGDKAAKGGDSAGQDKSQDESVVAEHGPAHTTVIAKDKMSDKHSVTSHHEDGHKHVSKGHDVHSAHEHSKAMFGETDPTQPGEATDMDSLDNEAPELPQA
jgi:hypothetical protein